MYTNVAEKYKDLKKIVILLKLTFLGIITIYF